MSKKDNNPLLFVSFCQKSAVLQKQSTFKPYTLRFTKSINKFILQVIPQNKIKSCSWEQDFII
ncbi:hypothetical protein CON64_07970 [Bacillus pseudomycoides]|nr:hypothetical protein CON64_07970 [Bacillus pseudomycoides]